MHFTQFVEKFEISAFFTDIRGVYFPLFGKIIYGIITNFRGIPEKFFETVEKKIHNSKNHFSK